MQVKSTQCRIEQSVSVIGTNPVCNRQERIEEIDSTDQETVGTIVGKTQKPLVLLRERVADSR